MTAALFIHSFPNTGLDTPRLRSETGVPSP
jgi:hypothetical protein